MRETNRRNWLHSGVRMTLAPSWLTITIDVGFSISMCGIAGIVSATADEGLRLALGRMMRIQRHRGPDGEGSWSGRVAGFQVGLTHNRLAILDLSEAGHQPMFLPDGSQALIYNGEIYNYKELRSDLEVEGVRFRSQCDT